jgi:hypothetical protein
MATVNHTSQVFADNTVFSWATLTTTDDEGQGAGYSGSGDRSVQVTGTFGAGGTLTVEGTIDGTVWATLNEPDGTALTFSAAGIKAVLEHVVAIRPHVTAGDGTTDLDVSLVVRNR